MQLVEERAPMGKLRHSRSTCLPPRPSKILQVTYGPSRTWLVFPTATAQLTRPRSADIPY